jgi:hypothetical protein
VPLVRGDESFREAGARVAAVACLVLVAALVLGWTSLVPVSVVLVGGLYAAELAIDDAPLDAATTGMAVALLVAAELAYWSLDERYPIPGDPGEGLRRAALVAVTGVGAAVVAALLLALVDAIRTRSLAVDLVGAVAAVAVFVTVLLAARAQGRASGPSQS